MESLEPVQSCFIRIIRYALMDQSDGVTVFHLKLIFTSPFIDVGAAIPLNGLLKPSFSC